VITSEIQTRLNSHNFTIINSVNFLPSGDLSGGHIKNSVLINHQGQRLRAFRYIRIHENGNWAEVGLGARRQFKVKGRYLNVRSWLVFYPSGNLKTTYLVGKQNLILRNTPVEFKEGEINFLESGGIRQGKLAVPTRLMVHGQEMTARNEISFLENEIVENIETETIYRGRFVGQTGGELLIKPSRFDSHGRVVRGVLQGQGNILVDGKNTFLLTGFLSFKDNILTEGTVAEKNQYWVHRGIIFDLVSDEDIGLYPDSKTVAYLYTDKDFMFDAGGKTLKLRAGRVSFWENGSLYYSVLSEPTELFVQGKSIKFKNGIMFKQNGNLRSGDLAEDAYLERKDGTLSLYSASSSVWFTDEGLVN